MLKGDIGKCRRHVSTGQGREPNAPRSLLADLAESAILDSGKDSVPEPAPDLAKGSTLDPVDRRSRCPAIQQTPGSWFSKHRDEKSHNWKEVGRRLRGFRGLAIFRTARKPTTAELKLRYAVLMQPRCDTGK